MLCQMNPGSPESQKTIPWAAPGAKREYQAAHQEVHQGPNGHPQGPDRRPRRSLEVQWTPRELPKAAGRVRREAPGDHFGSTKQPDPTSWHVPGCPFFVHRRGVSSIFPKLEKNQISKKLVFFKFAKVCRNHHACAQKHGTPVQAKMWGFRVLAAPRDQK